MPTTLTKEQEQVFKTYVDRWVEIGLSTDTDKKAAETAIDNVYKCARLAPPKQKVWVKNPREGCKKAHELSNGIATYDIIYGSFDAYWLASYMFMYYELGDKKCEQLLGLAEYAKVSGWAWPFDEAVVLCPKPSELHINNEGVLHNTDGPAIAYEEFCLYYINGTYMEPWMVATPVDQLDVKQVLNIQNVEQRAETIKRIGIENLLDQLPHEIIDRHKFTTKQDQRTHNYELYKVDYAKGGRPTRIYLKMTNPSTDEQLIEPVHPDCKTVKEAINFRNFGTVTEKGFQFPEILT